MSKDNSVSSKAGQMGRPLAPLSASIREKTHIKKLKEQKRRNAAFFSA
jgi:hypothetical protein